MALDMCRCRLGLLLLVFFFAQCQEFQPFPLENCQDQDLDILFIANNMLDSASQAEDIDCQLTFFQAVLDMLQAEEENRSTGLQVAITCAPYGQQNDAIFLEYTDSWTENVSCSKKESEDLTKATTKETLTFAHQLFHKKSAGSRENATHVALLVLSEYADHIIETIKSHQNERFEHPAEVRIFIVLVVPGSSINSLPYIPYSVAVPSYQQLLQDKHIPLAFCQKCQQPEWHLFQHEFGMSCHSIHSAANKLHWLQAGVECAKQGAELGQLETEQELKHVLNLQVHKHSSSSAASGKNEQGAMLDSMYIGLFKDDKQLIRSFRWGNSRPVLDTHWQLRGVDDDPGQACAAWQVLGNNQSTTNRKEGWLEVGCGEERTRHILCEIAIFYHSGQRLSSLKISAANRASYDEAITRGEFLDFNGRIVSLSIAHLNVSMAGGTLLQDKQTLMYFSCNNDENPGHLIPYSLVCDGQEHCTNMRDETLCHYRKCDPVTEFRCKSSQCVPIQSRCDMFPDCSDGSDEENCSQCKGDICCNGQCLPRNRFLDGEIDCAPCRSQGEILHDEIYNEKNKAHLDCLFICNRTECIVLSQLNDSVIDCRGPEGPLDETIGKLQRVNACSISTPDKDGPVVDLWSPKCVYVKDRLGGVLGCRNLAHLQACAQFSCPEGYVKCPHSYCIPFHAVQDGTVDCRLGEDELYLEGHTCRGNFECWNSRVCLHPDLVCDGSLHCPAGEDEMNCKVSCRDGFSCLAGTVIVTDYRKSEPLKSLVFVDRRTRYLDLSGVNMSLSFAVKDRGQFVNLLEIRMSNCSLSSASGGFAFKVDSLETVAFLDLSYNNIKSIARSSMFVYMSNLRKLNLSFNEELTLLSGEALRPLSRASLLETLDLSGTSLLSITDRTFLGLTSLRHLNLSSCKTLAFHSKVFPLKLTELDLRSTEIENFLPDSLFGLTIQKNLYTDNYKLCCPQVRGPGVAENRCQTTEDVISSCSNLVGMKLQRSILWIVGIIAVLGNLSVIVYRLFVHKNETTNKAFAMFVTNLSLSDLTMGIYLLIIAAADVHYRDEYVWSEKIWRLGALCQVGGFLSTLSSETSTFFIFLITVDRYVALKFPFGQYNFSKPVTILCSILSWSAGFMLALIPALPPFKKWVIYSSNGMCLGLPLTTERLAGWGYSVALFIVLNFIMFIAIACGQYLIYKAMSDNRMPRSQTPARRAQDISVAKQLSLVALTNFMCWFPVSLMGMLALSGYEIGLEAYAWSAVLVLPINSALNPILYTVPVFLAKCQQFMARLCKHK